MAAGISSRKFLWPLPQLPLGPRKLRKPLKCSCRGTCCLQDPVCQKHTLKGNMKTPFVSFSPSKFCMLIYLTKIDAFKLWCWIRLLRVPRTARRSNRSILKEINLEYSLEGLMLKLKPQYFGYLMRKTELKGKTLCWERLRARRERGDRG